MSASPALKIMKLRKQASAGIGNGKMTAELLLEGETVPYAHKGEVLFSEVTVDEGTGMVQLRVLFPNPDNYLLPGLFVKARIGPEHVGKRHRCSATGGGQKRRRNDDRLDSHCRKYRQSEPDQSLQNAGRQMACRLRPGSRKQGGCCRTAENYSGGIRPAGRDDNFSAVTSG